MACPVCGICQTSVGNLTTAEYISPRCYAILKAGSSATQAELAEYLIKRTAVSTHKEQP